MYEWVTGLCVSLGANPYDLVPFDKYANAALSLQNPSSAARAIDAGAPHIERVDRLVQCIAASRSQQNPLLDNIVSTVDQRLEKNRKA